MCACVGGRSIPRRGDHRNFRGDRLSAARIFAAAGPCVYTDSFVPYIIVIITILFAPFAHTYVITM